MDPNTTYMLALLISQYDTFSVLLLMLLSIIGIAAVGMFISGMILLLKDA